MRRQHDALSSFDWDSKRDTSIPVYGIPYAGFVKSSRDKQRSWRSLACPVRKDDTHNSSNNKVVGFAQLGFKPQHSLHLRSNKTPRV